MKTNKVQPLDAVNEESTKNNSGLPSIDGHLMQRHFDPNLNPNEESPPKIKPSKHENLENIQNSKAGNFLTLPYISILRLNLYIYE